MSTSVTVKASLEVELPIEDGGELCPEGLELTLLTITESVTLVDCPPEGTLGRDEDKELSVLEGKSGGEKDDVDEPFCVNDA